MKRVFFLCILFVSVAASMKAQDLSFIGLKAVTFGMKASTMSNKVVIMDSTTAYKDTATYIRNNRCLLYFTKDQNLELSNFRASSVQYEFCDNELEYVFINVSGNAEIDKALDELKKTFSKLGCKGQKDYKKCTQLDASAKGMRLIINIDRKKQLMNFVIIPKAPR